MHTDRKKLSFYLLISLFVLSGFLAAQNNAPPTSELKFPEVEGWEKGDIAKLGTREMGYTIAYGSEDNDNVTIYVYDAGYKDIGNGVDNKLVQNEIKQAAVGIEALGEAGLYQNVKKLGDSTVSLGGANGKTKALLSKFTFKLRGQDVESRIYLFGYQGNFIKIRASRPKGAEGSEPAHLSRLLAELDKMFAK